MTHSFDQRTAEWLRHRAGKVTASRIADLMAKTKSGYSTSRANYRAQLVVERLTGEVEASFCSPAMQHGIDTEAEAREAYQQHMLCTVQELGFADHPTIEMAGASPDGLVADDGMVEIKCPLTATHIDTLLTGAVPDKYHKQMQFQMACTGRNYCDFVSYDPRLPDTMRLFVQRVPRSDDYIAEIEREVTAFLAEVDDTVAQLRTKFALADQLSQCLAAA